MTACALCGAGLPEGARFCPACGAPAQEPASAADERKLATVLFADLVGSTELGASQDPERTRALLARFYGAMSEEVEGAGGTVEKFAGDAVMAAFGVPAAHEDHAERALHCGLSMQRRLDELFADALSLRIGVNTGEVMAGRPREGSSFVTGDAVNVAARLEQAAPGETLVGERTVAAGRGRRRSSSPSRPPSRRKESRAASSAGGSFVRSRSCARGASAGCGARSSAARASSSCCRRPSDGEAFWTAMQNALELCTDPKDCGEKYSQLALQTVTRVGMWKRIPEEDQIRGWISRALELTEPGSAARVEALLAKSVQEDSDEAAREAGVLAEQLDNAELRSMAGGPGRTWRS
jgi:class 3 adenylate cyclase